MSNRDQRAFQIIAQLHSEFEGVLHGAVQIVLRHSSSASALVSELEKMGYQVDTEFNYLITASPLEMIFDQSLTEDDRRFLHDPGNFIAG